MKGVYFSSIIEDLVSIVEPNYKLSKYLIDGKEYVSVVEVENLVEPEYYKQLQRTYPQTIITK